MTSKDEVEHSVDYAYCSYWLERIPLAHRRLYREITVTADALIDILIFTSPGYPLADLYRSLGET